LEQLANQFLKEEGAGKNIQYELLIRDKVRLIGDLEIFGIAVPFELDLDPYVMEDGNLQLKATALSLGNLKLPISFVMSQIQKQLELPEWVTVHSEAKYLVLHLNEFELSSGIHFSMEHINLPENDIR